MLRLTAFLPALAALAAAPRALADGSSGTLGQGAVGAHELREGAVTLAKIADLGGARVLGRAAGASSGAPEALDAQALREVLDSGALTLSRASMIEAEAAEVPVQVQEVSLLGYAAPGDGGAARYRRVASEPPHPGKFRSGDGAWWELVPPAIGINPLQFGAIGDGTADDAGAFQDLATYCQNYSSWYSGFGDYASPIDLGGRIYRLESAVHIPVGVHLKNGIIRFKESALLGDYGLCLGVNAASGSSISQVVENVQFYISGGLSANVNAALLYIPRTMGTRLLNVNIDAGGGTYRARYGAYIGRYRAWSVDVLGGRYFGGECPLRIGRQNDHTGLKVEPVAIDHGRLMNLLLCNPKGARILGRIEHSDGPYNIVITSETGGSGDAADNVTLENAYCYNNSEYWAPGNSCIRFGLDVPGTEGWDGAGVITSGSNGGHLSLINCYMVSTKTQCVVQARALAGIDIRNVKWFARGRVGISGVTGNFVNGETVRGGSSSVTAVIHSTGDPNYLYLESDDGLFTNGETLTGATSGATATANTSTAARPRFAEFEGVCAASSIRQVRNQNSGSLLPMMQSTASQIVAVDLPGGVFTPTLRGSGAAGSFASQSVSGRWTVTNSILEVSAKLSWSGASGASGDTELLLPSGLADFMTTPAAAAVSASGFAGPVQAYLPGDGRAVLKIQQANSTSSAPIPASGSLRVTLSAPLDFAD